VAPLCYVIRCSLDHAYPALPLGPWLAPRAAGRETPAAPRPRDLLPRARGDRRRRSSLYCASRSFTRPAAAPTTRGPRLSCRLLFLGEPFVVARVRIKRVTPDHYIRRRYAEGSPPSQLREPEPKFFGLFFLTEITLKLGARPNSARRHLLFLSDGYHGPYERWGCAIQSQNIFCTIRLMYISKPRNKQKLIRSPGGNLRRRAAFYGTIFFVRHPPRRSASTSASLSAPVIIAPARSVAARSGSSNRWLYRAVVSGLV
jgi:hypothetical protein